jgi:hypothetical protein
VIEGNGENKSGCQMKLLRSHDRCENEKATFHEEDHISERLDGGINVGVIRGSW